jgi:L-fuculose-phosphate aldolase
MSLTIGRSTEDQLRQELVRFGKWLYRLGFTPGTSGNLSVRLTPDTLLVTPTGMSKRLMRQDDMVIVDLQGHHVSGARRVTSEIGMHLAVYHQRPEIDAVVHSHPPVATAFACAGLALDEMLCQEAAMTLGAVPLAGYATTGTPEVAASLEPFLDFHDAILMANHGVVSYGKTLMDAFLKMETVEHLAKVHFTTHQLGLANPLQPEQLEQLRDAKRKYLENAI